MTKRIDRTGKRFGRLLVIRQAETLRPGVLRWECKCDCGNTSIVHGSALGRSTNSCGCLEAENRKTVNVTHGLSYAPEKVAFDSMRSRCNNPKNPAWYRYGGRGIEVRFATLEDFVAHIGRRPSPAHSVDRIDNDGHYEPGNVRWATKKEQRNNRRDTKLYEFNGISDNATGWAKRIGIRGSSVLYRLRAGWPVEKAITTPATKPGPRNQQKLTNQE